MKAFKEPVFKNRSLELRFENDEVCIYATKEGLEEMIFLCQQLVAKPSQGHIHLEDYEVLTADSKTCKTDNILFGDT